LKHSDNGLNFDFTHHFQMKMSLFGLCTLFSKVILLSTRSV